MRITTAMLEKQIETTKIVTGRSDLRPEYNREKGGWQLLGKSPDGTESIMYGIDRGGSTRDFYNQLYGFCQGYIAASKFTLKTKGIV